MIFKRFVPMLCAVALVLSFLTLASARGAPNTAETAQAAVSVTPVVTADVPSMTGYDVIQNLSTEPRALISAEPFRLSLTVKRRLSPTVYWRSGLNRYVPTNDAGGLRAVQRRI